jgi:hypothetical protein
MINEEQAIKTLIEKETATWHSGDIKGHAECWVARPYSRILISLPDGKNFDVPVDAMIHPTLKSMGLPVVSKNTNYTFSITGNGAWSSHNQETTKQDGSVSYSYEIQIFEKIDGQWKFVGQSVHVYK